ncbi:MAG: cell division protein FtsH [Pirellulaceae bacterium]|nr:cell division protein FtsH [Pirellulaceae bacterium]
MTPANFTPNEIATAYHEAGHAVMALVLGRNVQRVSVQDNQLRLGHCEIKKGRFRPIKDGLETEILILLGGLAAETRQMGNYDSAGAAQDLRGVRSLTQLRAAGRRQVERLERRMLDKAEYILDQPGVWLAAQRIADELLRHTTLSGRAARHLFDQAAAQAKAEGNGH